MAQKKGKTSKAQKKGKTPRKTMPGVKAMDDTNGGGGGMSAKASLEPGLRPALQRLFTDYPSLADKCVCFNAHGVAKVCGYGYEE